MHKKSRLSHGSVQQAKDGEHKKVWGGGGGGASTSHSYAAVIE